MESLADLPDFRCDRLSLRKAGPLFAINNSARVDGIDGILRPDGGSGFLTKRFPVRERPAAGPMGGLQSIS